MKFYLGTHQPAWLAAVDVPLFVSHNRLKNRRTLPRALVPCGIDSGGFTIVTRDGNYDAHPARQYADAVRRYRDEIGIDWAAIQDWMCEPFALARTGLTIEDHQRRTIDSYLELSSIAPDVAWLPVLQGWAITDYWRHVDMYLARGLDLKIAHRVGIGSVCRRQATGAAEHIVASLVADGIRLHLFGFKKVGLVNVVAAVSASDLSADSAAWSMNARRDPPLPGHRDRHRNCANCVDYALEWRRELLNGLAAAPRGRQLSFGRVA